MVQDQESNHGHTDFSGSMGGGISEKIRCTNESTKSKGLKIPVALVECNKTQKWGCRLSLCRTFESRKPVKEYP